MITQLEGELTAENERLRAENTLLRGQLSLALRSLCDVEDYFYND